MGLRGIVLGYGDDLAEGTWDDSLGFLAVVAAHHSMGLTTSGLSVREDSAVVAVQYALDEGEGALLVDQVLWRVSREHAVERKCLWLLLGVLLPQVYLIIFGIRLHHADTPCHY